MQLLRANFTLFLFLALLAPVVAAEPLTLSYFERPPYYFTNDAGQPEGFLVDRIREVLVEADIEANFIALTPYRILYVLPRAKTPHCSIGWFKSPEREEFAKFSLPIYRNRASVLLTSQKQRDKFTSLATLREVFSVSTLSMARMAEFSYGNFVDGLLAEMGPTSLFFTGEQGDLLQAIVREEASYMLIAPEEVGKLANAAGIALGDLAIIRLSDLPAGNLRYLMCSQAVPDETIDQLNRALSNLYKRWGSENCK